MGDTRVDSMLVADLLATPGDRQVDAVLRLDHAQRGACLIALLALIEGSLGEVDEFVGQEPGATLARIADRIRSRPIEQET